MSDEKTNFHVGDWIVHSRYGLGKIEGRDVKELGGKKKNYFKVGFSGGFYWLPNSNVDALYIRPIASEKEVKSALKILKENYEELPKNHKDRQKQIQECLKGVSLKDKMKLIRDLSARKKEYSLNFKENEILARLKENFLKEWQICCGKEMDVLEEKLEEMIHDSVAV
jgi:CarD family transcriptional regulator